jgi:hypothetical protein
MCVTAQWHGANPCRKVRSWLRLTPYMKIGFIRRYRGASRLILIYVEIERSLALTSMAAYRMSAMAGDATDVMRLCERSNLDCFRIVVARRGIAVE